MKGVAVAVELHLHTNDVCMRFVRERDGEMKVISELVVSNSKYRMHRHKEIVGSFAIQSLNPSTSLSSTNSPNGWQKVAAPIPAKALKTMRVGKPMGSEDADGAFVAMVGVAGVAAAAVMVAKGLAELS